TTGDDKSVILRLSSRRQMIRYNSHSVFCTHHEAKQRAETHRRCRADEIEPGHRRLEGGVQLRCALKPFNRAAQRRPNEAQAFNINVITAPGDYLINDQRTFASAVRQA